MVVDLIGWVGAILFSACAVPQVVKCYKQGHAKGISYIFLGMWFVGEVLSLIYALIKLQSAPLLTNYVFNLLCLIVIIKYRLFPVKRKRGRRMK